MADDDLLALSFALQLFYGNSIEYHEDYVVPAVVKLDKNTSFFMMNAAAFG